MVYFSSYGRGWKEGYRKVLGEREEKGNSGMKPFFPRWLSNPSGRTPDYYIRNDGNPKKHAVSDRIFKLIESKQLIQFEGSLSQLENFQTK